MSICGTHKFVLRLKRASSLQEQFRTNPLTAPADFDPDFDRRFRSLLDRNAVDVLDLPNARIDQAGFGTWENRQWITALGVAHDRRPRSLVYEAVVGRDTGCGVANYD